MGEYPFLVNQRGTGERGPGANQDKKILLAEGGTEQGEIGFSF